MDIIITTSQVVIALGLLNVWLVRSGRPTAFRGGGANNMKEEFEVYGLPPWFMGFIGFLKVSLALALIAGIWFPDVTRIAAIGIAALMVGAVAMHLKVGDPLLKSIPALSLFVLASLVGLA